MAYTSIRHGVGSSQRPFVLSKKDKNYTTRYFKSTIVGDPNGIRVEYDSLEFAATSGGNVKRNLAYVTAAGAATPSSVDTVHNSLRLGTAATIAGLASAGRFTVEGNPANDSAGTIGALLIDSNLAASTHVPNTAGIRFTKSGAASFPYAMAIDDSGLMKGSTVSNMADAIKIRRPDGSLGYIPVYSS